MNNTTRINRFLMAGLVIVLCSTTILISCGDDDTPIAPPTVSDPTFRQLSALSTVTAWEKVWGVSATDMFLMGEDGYVYTGDGASWTKAASTVEIDWTMHSAWGAAANNVFFVGSQADGIIDTVIDSSGTLWDTTYPPIADRPVMTHYNGSVFNEVLLDFEWGLYDIWGAAADTIFAVGFDGSILKYEGDGSTITYDGSDWSIMATGGATPAWLNSVWGTSGTSVFTSGTDGALLHYDGTDWSVITTHSVEDLWDVWGFSDTSVYCVGSGGTVLHYDGTSVTKMTTPITTTLYSIWGYDEDDIYAVGWNGVILHYDGSAWTEDDSHTDYGFLSVWGTAGGTVYAAGQTVMESNGGDWTPVKVRNEPDFNDVWAGGGTVVAVGTGGNILYSTTSYSFSSMTITGGSTANLNGVGGFGDSAFFVVGDGGLILERTGASEWTEMTSGTSEDLYAVAVLSDTVAMAVGSGGTLAIYDGSSWTEPNSALVSEDMYDVWLGLTTEDTVIGYAVGDGGAIVAYNGTTLLQIDSPTALPLRGVVGFASGEVYAVGDGGAILYRNPDPYSWTGITSGTVENLTSIWAADDDNMFIAGESGRVFKFDGTSLSALETNANINLSGVAGLSAANVYVVGEHNHILHYSR